MKKMKTIILALCAGLMLQSCSNALKGAGLGALGGGVLGGVVGRIAGNTGVGAAIGAAVGATAGTLIGRHMDKVKAQAQAVQNAQVQSVTDANGLQAVKVTFDSGILFTSGSSTLSSTARTSLSQFANEVLIPNPDCDVAIQGYTDNTPFRGYSAAQSVQKNLELSQQRAQAVTNYLLSIGVSAAQIRSTMGFGEENPVASNSTADGKAQNRRVEVYLYASQTMIDAANAGTLQ
ncbi:MAG: OmpA family protein [Prevotella sp.]|nr:OmpA family protein [Prevotella sp.]